MFIYVKLQDKRTLGEILLKLLGIVKLNINGNAEFRNERRMFNENVETSCSMFCFVLLCFALLCFVFFRDAFFFFFRKFSLFSATRSLNNLDDNTTREISFEFLKAGKT